MAGYNQPMKIAIANPNDVRGAILAGLDAQGRSKYAFAKAAAEAGICQHHTVDSVLSPPGSASATTPTLATTIRLLHAAGFDLMAVKR